MRPLPSRLLLIADGFAVGRPELSATVIQARTLALVDAGIRWILLRDHAASPKQFAEAAAELATQLRDRQPDVTLSISRHADVAHQLDAGIHIGERGPDWDEVSDLPLVGFSAHSATQALVAQRAGAHYVTFSPVFRTRTHPDAAPAGLDALRRCVDAVEIPVLALGGMTAPRARLALAVGASGAAAISSLLFAYDPEVTVPHFLRAVGELASDREGRA
ncbi:MAG: thiamine phosphate synthase [Rubricoccaceae bacterium]